MTTKITTWTPEDENKLLELHARYGMEHNKWQLISEEMGKTEPSVRHHWRFHWDRITSRLQESPYPRYDQPLEMDGDAVIIPDLELPFHHAEFVNKVLDVAQAWNIRQAVLAGDMLHFDSLSTLGKKWKKSKQKGGLDDEQEQLFINFATGLGSRQQERAFALLEKIGHKEEDDGLSTELRVATKAIRALKECFDKVDVIIGNHEGRLLRAMDTPLIPDEILKLVEAGDWRIAPFYFSFVNSDRGKFRIEHPRSTAKSAAEQLAAKNQCHVIMAHSHRLSWSWDISGNYYAIQIGHCVDEFRLPYAAQRSSLQTHLLAACIIRDGYPWILHQKSDWNKLLKLK
jgi:hypothetical protein